MNGNILIRTDEKTVFNKENNFIEINANNVKNALCDLSTDTDDLEKVLVASIKSLSDNNEDYAAAKIVMVAISTFMKCVEFEPHENYILKSAKALCKSYLDS